MRQHFLISVVCALVLATPAGAQPFKEWLDQGAVVYERRDGPRCAELFGSSGKAKAFATLTGPTTVCPNTAYTYTVTSWDCPTGEKEYSFIPLSGVPSGGGPLYSYETTKNINITWFNPGATPTTGGLHVDVRSWDDVSNSYILCGTDFLSITILPGWPATISGNFLPPGPGSYAYSVSPGAPGATSYTWTLPPGVQCSSGCNTTGITTDITPNAQSGNVKVMANVPTGMCNNVISRFLYISPCFGRELGQYDATKITGRVVAGDFDQDGKRDDIAALYDYGNNVVKMHVWLHDGTSLVYQGDHGWWEGVSYTANNVTGRVVSGDFDNDGYFDDIAAMYYYGGFNTKIHVWTSTGSSFTDPSMNGWVSMTQYDATKTTYRVVSGDFDQDGYHDDILSFYYYGGFQIAMHVWQSNGSSFSGSSPWFSHASYDGNKITGRVVSGDFDRDGFVDDVTAFYDYGGFHMTAHVWLSTGSGFQGNSWYSWYVHNNYDPDKITGRVVSVDLNGDSKIDEIAAFYDYGNFNTNIHVWQSTGSSFSEPSMAGWWSNANYDANKLTYRVVSGYFSPFLPGPLKRYKHRYDDIAGFYKYGAFSTTAHGWYGQVSAFTYSGNNGLWNVCDY